MRTFPAGTIKREPSDTLPEILMRLLPYRVTDALRGTLGFGRIEEIHLRRGRQMSVTVGGANRFLPVVMEASGMELLLAELANGSLYAHEETLKKGYLMLPGGIRVGVAGRASVSEGRITGISEISALCIRIPGHLPVSGQPVRELLELARWTSGVLIWSPPGEGKTTLLCAAALACAGETERLSAKRTVFVDTRGETAFPEDGGACALEVLRGYPKAEGIEIGCRTLGAEVIFCDEIGAGETAAVLAAANCGVPLVATAHAGSVQGLLTRPGFEEVHRARVFGTYLGIKKNGRGGFLFERTPWEEVAHGDQTDRSLAGGGGGDPSGSSGDAPGTQTACGDG